MIVTESRRTRGWSRESAEVIMDKKEIQGILTELFVKMGKAEQTLRNAQDEVQRTKHTLVEELVGWKMTQCLAPNMSMIRRYVNSR